MAFNLFKRKEIADIIFKGGTIYTMDPEAATVQNLACKDGCIIALGADEVLKEHQGTHTQIIDLQNKFVLPGFIEANGHPVKTIFDDTYIRLEETMTPQDIVSNIATFKNAHPQSDCYLAYGYDESSIDESMQAQLRISFDEISKETPILVIASDGLHMLLNTASAELIKEQAEEMQIPVITPDFVMAVLASTDYETLIINALTEAYLAAEKGFTSIFNIATFHYLDNTYRDFLIDLYQTDMTKQRYFSSLLLNRPFPDRRILHLLDQNRTACTELKRKINFDTLYIQCASNKDNINYMSEEYLTQICGKAADKGYNIRVDALDKDVAIQVLNILGNLQSTYKKSVFSVESEHPFTEDELSEVFTGDVHIYTKKSTAPHPQSVQETIDALTLKASSYLGIEDLCGSMEKGKWADFAIYEKDLTKLSSIADFKNRQADMTVLGGEIVYIKGADTTENWIEKMTSHFKAMSEEFSFDENV